MKSEQMTFYNDSNGLDYINAFAAALEPFGIYVEDLTDPDGDTLDVRLTDKEPENEWEC